MKFQKVGKMVGKTLNQRLKSLSKLGNAVVIITDGLKRSEKR